MDLKHLDTFYLVLEEFYSKTRSPSVTQISKNCKRNPYMVLISTIISLRTKDAVTVESSKKLFKLAKSPKEMLKYSPEDIQMAIYPAGFYKKKSYTILEISKTLIDRYDGAVPSSLDELLKLKGVGRKTANLVLVEGFDKDAICVDTHVHRICNRAGLVDTKTPDETEIVLRRILPKVYWKKINEMLVVYGQNICKPVSPACFYCKFEQICAKKL